MMGKEIHQIDVIGYLKTKDFTLFNLLHLFLSVVLVFSVLLSAPALRLVGTPLELEKLSIRTDVPLGKSIVRAETPRFLLDTLGFL